MDGRRQYRHGDRGESRLQREPYLQGQFRQSDLTYGEGDVNKALVEVWAGVEWRTSSGWALQYLARWESAELRGGSGSRSFTCGSIEISKSFR